MSAQPARVDPGWLRLRAQADARARADGAADLVRTLTTHLRQRRPASDPGSAMRLVDVGSGTGNGARWLRDLLDTSQDWRLLDRDPRILEATAADVGTWARPVVADVEDLPGLLEAEPADVVTCQALLDVLTAREADSLLSSAAASRAAVLLALTVTGEVGLAPAHPDDDLVAQAFDDHQHRHGRLGPDAGTYTSTRLRACGYQVTTAATPWRLGPAQAELTRAWLRGRAEAATEQAPHLTETIRHWHADRDGAAAGGRLQAVVGHVDVLGLPPGETRS